MLHLLKIRRWTGQAFSHCRAHSGGRELLSKLFYEALAEDTLAVAVDSGRGMARMLRVFYSKSATMDSKDERGCFLGTGFTRVCV